MTAGTLLDFLIITGLVWLAWQVVAGRELFRAIIMFIALGLAMAVAWARLGAPDLALAEAAIGAGLTGAMLLATYRRLLEHNPAKGGQRYARSSRLALPVAVMSSLLVMLLGLTLVNIMPVEGEVAGQQAIQLMQAVPMENPVTGVLLLWRGYDTLLEMSALVAAWLALRILQPQDAATLPPLSSSIPLLQALLAAAVPIAVLVGGYLLHAGGKAPGGAFQAGAVLAGAGVLLGLTGSLQRSTRASRLLRAGVVLGLIVFSVLGLGQLAFGQPAFAIPGLWTIYLVEGALTVSIALTLLLLFLGSAGVRRPAP
ncbi:MAG: DUF4040 domain-containing protein [Chromatiales bacterium]|nr:DUF4040 domain-containing protein [Chromatiales bacterium]